MLRLAALLAALVFASPAVAMNELRGEPLSKVEEIGRAHGASIEKLNAADTAAMDANTSERPRPSDIYLLTAGPGVIIVMLVRDGVVIFSSEPVDQARINQILKRGSV